MWPSIALVVVELSLETKRLFGWLRLFLEGNTQIFHFAITSPFSLRTPVIPEAATTGAPGLRADYGAGYYAAFLVDPDGYGIEAYFAEKA